MGAPNPAAPHSHSPFRFRNRLKGAARRQSAERPSSRRYADPRPLQATIGLTVEPYRTGAWPRHRPLARRVHGVPFAPLAELRMSSLQGLDASGVAEPIC
jgi:hypothetical protein